LQRNSKSDTYTRPCNGRSVRFHRVLNPGLRTFFVLGEFFLKNRFHETARKLSEIRPFLLIPSPI
jgi:hypothetical protein